MSSKSSSNFKENENFVIEDAHEVVILTTLTTFSSFLFVGICT